MSLKTLSSVRLIKRHSIHVHLCLIMKMTQISCSTTQKKWMKSCCKMFSVSSFMGKHNFFVIDESFSFAFSLNLLITSAINGNASSSIHCLSGCMSLWNIASKLDWKLFACCLLRAWERRAAVINLKSRKLLTTKASKSVPDSVALRTS